MIYRGVKHNTENDKRKNLRDWLKAVVISTCAVALIAAVVVLSGRLGIR